MNCASQADYDSWRSQIQIMTVAKQKEQFVSQLVNGMTDDEIDDALLDYVGQIERNTSDDGFTSFETNFFSHTQFRNLEGVFLIGDRILAEYKDARISIMNGDWSVLDEIKNDAEFPENYQSYTDLENVLIERHDLLDNAI